jgi:hypothetical protein
MTQTNTPSKVVTDSPDFIGAPSVVIAHTDGKVGFYGATPVVAQTVAVAATDAATTQALANSLRAALVALGLVK